MPLPDVLRERTLVPGRPAVAQAVALASALVAHAGKQTDGADPVEAIHQVRLLLKSLRALLRLLSSPATGRPPARLDARLQALGQELSPTRDRDVAGLTLDELVRKRGSAAEQAAAKRWIHAVHPTPPDPETLARTVRGLERLAPALRRHLKASATQTALADGLARSIKKAKRWRERAMKSRKSEAFHAWRRWQKRLEIQLRWLRDGAGPRVGALLSELHDRQEDLGQLHDLDLLLEGLQRSLSHGSPSQVRDARHLLPLVLDRQQRLQRRVIRRARDTSDARLARALKQIRRAVGK
jgi:CHAD domain-containing protein